MRFFVRKHTFKTLKIVSFSKSKVASKSYFWRWLLEMKYQIFLTPQLFLSGFKNFHVHTYPFSNRICPSTRIRHVSELTLVLRTPLGILATEHASRLPSYSTNDKEPGSILLRHRIKNYPDSASTPLRIHSGLKNLRTRMPNSPDTCGLKP